MFWWNILWGVIPLLTVAIIFVVKRKLLWTAPLISTAIASITYMMSIGIRTSPLGVWGFLLEFFGTYERRFFFFMVMLKHLEIVVALTLIAYLVAYMINRKQK